MQECHTKVAQIGERLIKNKNAFDTNNKSEIKRELNRIFNKIDDIVYKTQDGSLKDLHKEIDDKKFPLSIIFKEFYLVMDTYISESICRKGEREYATLIRKYLCKAGAEKLVEIYHFMANIAIIKLGCTRIYHVDKSNKGKSPHIITDDEFFLKNVNNKTYRISKSNVEECVIHNYKKIGLGNLQTARVLLAIARDFRQRTQRFCPHIYNNWKPKAKRQHKEFEEWMVKLMSFIDNVSNKLYK